ncbi:type VI secretion protein, EvpB/VC_A0108 family [Oceanospirillum multiglobuliferum]|uniref:TssC1 N-terminal domain-containing protein n=1 Tax=Oceanospirillum multiglobuliferum TaxID=64969 RepID=A0A1T4MTF1_9GAMM|nr:type VI secretion system contractile sheath large subunit [Oceanospirillum multiglobuliferum]OPX56899.1 hypothetical protein BTE48_00230 [Oceanospirillum multiglobuliferum]SJZ70107.1 type VI secretion protein, EvpB/VC_A0108 family [Oceanospirillum multiglobuliferum]
MSLAPELLSALMINPSENEADLPCKILCLGHYSGRKVTALQPLTLDCAMPERTLASLAIEIDFSPLFPDWQQPYTIQCLEDFNPDRLLINIPALAQGIQLRDDWLFCDELRRSEISEKVAQYLLNYQHELENVDDPESVGTYQEFLFADLEQLLCNLLDQVLHYPPLQQLEACWRQLYALAASSRHHKASTVVILDCDRSLLEDELLGHGNLQDSNLFDHVYSHELGQYGGQPYTYIACDFALTRSEQDLDLLAKLALLGQAAHLPIGVPVQPHFLAVERYDQLLNENISEWFTSPRLLKLRNLCQHSSSRYLFMLMPRMVLRSPYKGLYQHLNYQEKTDTSGHHLLWGYAIYSLAANILNAFEQQKAFTLLTGSEWGQERLCQPYIDPIDDIKIAPLEIDFPVSLIADLADQGITVLSPLSEQKSHFFAQLNSLHTLADSKDVSPDNQLPYLLTLSRIAHMLKMRVREQIGSLDDPQALKQKLERWLKAFVVDLEAPAQEVMMKKPFRAVHVSFEEISQQSPMQKIDAGPLVYAGQLREMALSIQFVPHLRYLNQQFSLSLELMLKESDNG